MSTKVLANDLNNCVINFDRKLVVTNLLDEYGGLLEEIAKVIGVYISTEEAKGRKFKKTFMVRGLQLDSDNEVITVVSEEKLEQQKQHLKDPHSMLYSAESSGFSNPLPTEFIPLKHIHVKVSSLKIEEQSYNEPSETTAVKDCKQSKTKRSALGAVLETQKAIALVAENTEKTTAKKSSEPENKKNVLGTLFKRQETVVAAKKNIKSEPVSKETQEISSVTTKSTPKMDKTAGSTPDKKSKSKGEIDKFLMKKDDINDIIKPPTPKKLDEFFKKGQKIKKDPPANVSANLFEESASSSDDEEALDALKREIMSNDEEQTSSGVSNKRRRILDSDDEDAGPSVKIKRQEEMPDEMHNPKKVETFIDDDDFIVTVKPKKAASKTTSSTINAKKESPKSPENKETNLITLNIKKKQGNIMSFFAKK